jgi:hypothetical protein
MLGTVLTMPIIGVQKSTLPRSSLEIFILVYLVGIGMFLILLQEEIFWVLPLEKHAL